MRKTYTLFGGNTILSSDCDLLEVFSSGILAPKDRAPFGPHQKKRSLWERECIPAPEIVFVQRMLVRGRNRVWQMEECVFL